MAWCVITYATNPGVEALAERRVVSRELGQDAGICAVGGFCPGGFGQSALFLQGGTGTGDHFAESAG